MKLRATIAVEFEVGDYREAAAFQRKLEGCIDHLRGDFADVSLSMTRRRGAQPMLKTDIRRTCVSSGRLNAYE